jgi:hypothetical protein
LGFLAILIVVPVSEGIAATRVVCIKKGDALIVRSTKCKAGEVLGNSANLPQSGRTGPVGDSGSSVNAVALGRQTVFTAFNATTVVGNSVVVKEQLCPIGTVTLGGGCISSSRFVIMLDTYPFDSTPQQAWRCRFKNTQQFDSILANLTVLAICGNPS